MSDLLNMEENFGIQELYELKIKTTSKMRIGDKLFGEDETVLFFETAELTALDENSFIRRASGGYSNRNLILWRDIASARFGIDKGVLSELDLGFLLNAKIAIESPILVGKREQKTTNSNGILTLKEFPHGKMFCYQYTENGYVKNVTATIQGKSIDFGIENALTPFIIDYTFNYSQVTNYYIGDNELSGIFRMEAKTRLKDDVEGKERTGIIVIPKVQITSGLNIILGTKATPIVGNFIFTSISTSVVDRKQSPSENNVVYAMYVLDTDIDAI